MGKRGNKAVSLDSMFNPTSVAIAGVADGNMGQMFLDILLDSGFKGKVYPLNPKGGEVSGLKVYANIKDIPEPVDYVISCVRAALAPQLVKDCAENGVKVVSIFTAGFSESGCQEGRELEEEVQRLAHATGVRILGPNCLGVYCPKAGLSFASDFPKQSGGVALICQSGGNAIYLIRAAAQRGVRFSKVISYGNACDINEADLLEYFTEDADTKIVAAYIEGIEDGPRFHQALGKLSAAKPVIALKAGYTPAGARVVSSHTDALAGSDGVWGGLFQQSGAICVCDLEELLDMLVAFSYLAAPQGRRVAIYGGGGGFCVLATDRFAANGFTVPPLPVQMQREISQEVESFAGSVAGFITSNPIDVATLVSREGHCNILRRLASYEGLDLLVAQISLNNSAWPRAGSSWEIWPNLVTDAVIDIHAETDKPIAVILHAIVSNWDLQRALELQERCYEAGLPVYNSLAGAAKAMNRFFCYHEKRPG